MSDPLPLSPDELTLLREGFADESWNHLRLGVAVRRLLATLDREQEARALARTEVIAELRAEVMSASDDPEWVTRWRNVVLAALSRLGERE